MNGFIYRIGSNTNHLGRPPSFYRSSELHDAGARFGSVYAVREEDATAITETGTAFGFKGIVWSQRLWVDCDTEESARATKSFLTKEGYDYVEYSTGNRGRHFGIMRPSSPSHLLPLCDKKWAKETLPGTDLSLYWHLHLIRLPGALHEATGRPKELLYRQDGKSLFLPRYEPEELDSGPAPSTGAARPGIFTSFEVLANLTGGGGSGRHQQLVHLAKDLANCKVTLDEIVWVLGEVNKGFDEPKPHEEVARIARWAHERD